MSKSERSEVGMLAVGRTKEARSRTSVVSARAFAAGREALGNRDYDLAYAAFRWARRADPGNPLYLHGEAVVAHRTGNAYEAENLYRRVLDMAIRSFGIGDPRTMLVARDLVEFYQSVGRHDEAWMIGARIIDNLDRTAVVQSGIRILACLTEICALAGRLEDAMEIHRDAMAWRRRTFGEGHYKVDECVIGIAELGRLMGARARKLARSNHTTPVAIPGMAHEAANTLPV